MMWTHYLYSRELYIERKRSNARCEVLEITPLIYASTHTHTTPQNPQQQLQLITHRNLGESTLLLINAPMCSDLRGLMNRIDSLAYGFYWLRKCPVSIGCQVLRYSLLKEWILKTPVITKLRIRHFSNRSFWWSSQGFLPWGFKVFRDSCLYCHYRQS